MAIVQNRHIFISDFIVFIEMHHSQLTLAQNENIFVLLETKQKPLVQD